MRITPYNQLEAIEMLQARAFLLLMSGEVASLDGELSAPLWDLVGHWNEDDARQAIAAFEATQ